VLAETNKRLEICTSVIIFFNFQGRENNVWNCAHAHMHHTLKMNVKANKIIPESGKSSPHLHKSLL
jgi:hypothetical protein